MRRFLARAVVLVIGGCAAFTGGVGHVIADVVVPTRAGEVSVALDGERALTLPFPAQHIAVHWWGHPEAVVEVAIGGAPFVDAGRDEVGEHRGNGETYGALL